MNGECHAHLFMDGLNYKAATERHRYKVDREQVNLELQKYQHQGITYIRDGGDRFGVSEYARQVARDYGITYKTPLFAICREGHYGRIVGKSAATLKEFAALVREVKEKHGDFIKIMVSGIMEYSEFGRLSEAALDAIWIREMIHIAKEEGMAVMVHGNGTEAVLTAVEAGADSIEHGNYLNEECLLAMKEQGCVWVPTIVTTKNLIGCGRYPDKVLERIYEMECTNLTRAAEMDVCIATGSDAGAYLVPHGKGIRQEQEIFQEVWRTAGYADEVIRERIEWGEQAIRARF